jgi:hypothetical protein
MRGTFSVAASVKQLRTENVIGSSRNTSPFVTVQVITPEGLTA